MGILASVTSFAVPPWVRWGGMGIALLAAAAGGAWLTHAVMAGQYATLKAKYDTFVVKTEAEGKISEADKKRAEAVAKANLRRQEADHEAALVDLNARARANAERMRDDARGAGGRTVPEAGAPASVPEGSICFDRERLAARIEAALGGVAGRIAELARRGEAARIALNACIAGWDAQIDALEGTP